MKTKEKYYLECNLDLVLEVSEERKKAIIKKINGIISSALKGEDVIHLSKNINITSETDMLLSLVMGQPKDIN